METTFYKNQLNEDYGRSYREMIDHALIAIHRVMRPNKYVSSDLDELEWEDWRNCVNRSLFDNKYRSCFPSSLTGSKRRPCGEEGIKCRKSSGFNNQYIPNQFKYNPTTDKATKEIALNAYEFLLIYEAILHSRKVVYKYLSKFNLDKHVAFTDITRRIFDIDYTMDDHTRSYPNANWIIENIAETTVNYVIENAPIQDIVYDADADIISSIDKSDDIDLLIKSIKNITSGGRKTKKYKDKAHKNTKKIRKTKNK